MECKYVRIQTAPDSPFDVSYSSAVPILSKDGDVIALLAGRPRDGTYKEVLQDLERCMEKAGSEFSFSKRQARNKRGKYSAISTGVSMGCGSRVSNENNLVSFVP